MLLGGELRSAKRLSQHAIAIGHVAIGQEKLQREIILDSVAEFIQSLAAFGFQIFTREGVACGEHRFSALESTNLEIGEKSIGDLQFEPNSTRDGPMVPARLGLLDDVNAAAPDDDDDDDDQCPYLVYTASAGDRNRTGVRGKCEAGAAQMRGVRRYPG
ncbi:hypothetical protein DAEQUDRAFT_767347 [Daedalea quercina L-15889]|uniref:Uncharacterized protein n=1 Tax=Daedalea quercina L-15889 TaxID=1314783 RepID=A0A165NRT7_9APHY|nr:hypothetical protein DAEQUDRAFT_767347 [Daedalea quercina L-15889]